MPTDQAEAIVLRTSNVGDQDKIAVFFCREKGILRGVAKGARKFGNRFGSSLEPLSVVRVFYYEKERRDLVTVSGCDLMESFFEMQVEPATAFLLTYFAELIEEFAPARAREEVLYRLLLSVLHGLKEGGDREFAAAYFEAWFLQANGLLPDLSRCARCRKPLDRGWVGPKRDGAYCPDCAPIKKDELAPGIRDFLGWVHKNPPPGGSAAPPFPADLIAAIRRTLQALIVYHMEREPRSLHFLKTK
jgi:DNA repair protein RecO (recombination protein O)